MLWPETFVCNSTDKQWKAERRKVVTGTGLGVLLGLNPHESPEALPARYLRPAPIGVSRYLWWGTQMEEANLGAYSTITGDRCEPYHGFHVRGPLGSTLDAVTYIGEDSDQLDPKHFSSAPTYLDKFYAALFGLYEMYGEGPYPVELKNTGEHNRKHWGKKVPPHYEAQVQCQLYVTGAPAGIIVAKIGHADLRAHVVHRDDLFLEHAVEKAAEFLEKLDGIRAELSD